MFLLVYLKNQYLHLYYLFDILMILLRILSLFADFLRRTLPSGIPTVLNYKSKMLLIMT